MNSLGWSRREEAPIDTSQQTGLLSSLKSLNPFGGDGYVQLPTTEGPGAPLPAPNRREEEEGFFARDEQMGPDPDIQRVQHRSLSMFRHLFRALPHHGDEAAQIRHTPSLARYGAALRQHAHARKLDGANSQLAAPTSHASFTTSRIMGVGVAHSGDAEWSAIRDALGDSSPTVCTEADVKPRYRWSLGSVLFLASWAVMMGPMTYARHLLSAPRLPFTVAYFGSIGFTLFFSLGFGGEFLEGIIS
ncbi:hypothetical protein V500_06901 [Pseudogymnoascus sp. VKM F-4518 (FW-2643)]|nr:hypothetical protein V500_06901 [Pseudogymnoascus sp. VKM F-4518 (FW-2643)]